MGIPSSIGRYEILDKIGHGAMGVVYLAHDPRIDRKVAIKTIPALDQLPARDAEELRLRFTREAQAAGRLQHPGIVTIFDVGEHAGTWFIAMEYIEGETLEPYTRKGSLLPPPQVIDLIMQACEALDYAHREEIVHRDIKPANLMLLKNGRLKITDFGVAKDPQTTMTREGILVGTPNYMSPEQVMGKPLDGRSDLFSLAAVLYELLTGERPFPGDTVTTIMYRVLNEQPSPPQVLNKTISVQLAQVLMKGLAKEPEGRYQTGRELSRALQGKAFAAVAVAVGGRGDVVVAPAATRGTRTAGSGGAIGPAGGYRSTAAVATPARPATQTPAWTAPPRPPRESIGPPSAARPASAPARLAAVSVRHRPPLGFIVVVALGLVLLLPSATTIGDRWGAAGSGQTDRNGGAGAQQPQVAALAPPVSLPGEGESIKITWRTSPAGGRIYVDDVELPDGVLRVPAADRSAHTVVAENDCFIDTITWRAGSDADGATRTLQLRTPKVAKVPVTSEPPGGRIIVDGRDTGLSTPTDLPLAVCGAHMVAVRLEGHQQAERRITGTTEPVSLTLARQTAGFVRIAAPYSVTVYEKGRPLGSAGSPIRLASGAHKLTLKNEELFVERTIDVEVKDGRTIAPDAGLPGLGTITVLASPSNCNIQVNGRDFGSPPILEHRLAAGTYSVRATYLPTGETQESSVTVKAGGDARVPFKFKP